MGTGKSTVGRHAAEISGREFVDLDAEIVAKHGEISTIFEQSGADAFRDMERAVVAEVAPRRNLIIATGGGTLLDPTNVVAMLGADIFTLTATPEEIADRITTDGIRSRPLLGDAEDPVVRVTELLAERDDAYTKFTQIDTTGKSVEQVVQDLVDAGADLSAPEVDRTDNRELMLWLVIAVALALVVIMFVLLMTF